jgi:outer membrane protein assembly factor BamB
MEDNPISESEISQPPAHEGSPFGESTTRNPRPMRVWPGLVLLGLYWAVIVWVGGLGLPITTTFMSQAGAGALLTLLFPIWWLTNGTVRGRDRLLILAATVAGGAVAVAVSQKTLGTMGVLLTALPFAFTVWGLWLAVARRTSPAVTRWGAIVAISLVWAFCSLLRMDGLSGDLKPDIRWRWSPTTEDAYLAERLRTTDAVPSADALAGDSAREIQAGPGDWPAFRGPMRNGEVRGLEIATDWAATPPQLVWRQRIGPAWSSMLVIGQRVFTQEQVGEREAVVCLDASTGRRLWAHEDETRFWDSQSGAGPRATPELAGGWLYTQGGTGKLNCLNAATGVRKWTRDLVEDSGAALPMWGFSSSPLVRGDVVMAFAGGRAKKGLLAYRATDGKPVWNIATGPISYSSPQPVTLEGESQVLFLSDHGLIALEPASGKLLWQHDAPGQGVWRATQPAAVGAASVLVGSEDLGTICLDLDDDKGTWTVNQRWASKALKPAYNDFVVFDGCAYGFDGSIFCCLDLKTGKRRWKGGRYGHGQVLLLADQRLLVISSEMGEVVLLAADFEKHRELGRFQAIEGKTWNHPAIAQDCLYVRNDHEIACYRLPAASP